VDVSFKTAGVDVEFENVENGFDNVEMDLKK